MRSKNDGCLREKLIITDSPRLRIICDSTKKIKTVQLLYIEKGVKQSVIHNKPPRRFGYILQTKVIQKLNCFWIGELDMIHTLLLRSSKYIIGGPYCQKEIAGDDFMQI